MTDAWLVRFPTFITRMTTDNKGGKNSSALSIGFIPRLTLCWRPRRLLINFWVKLVYFRKSNIFPTSWMSEKQTSVSHRSIESEGISLDAGLRLGGLPALDLCDMVIAVLQSTHHAVRDHRSMIQVPRSRARSEIQSTNPNTKSISNSNREVDELSDVDHVVTSAKPSQFEAQLYISDDKTHRVFDRINLEPQIQIKHVDTKKPTRRHNDER